ncbi:hypothetical protein GCM10011354_11060 [Egicoccus halophilus]|uniref:Flp pilus assembly protein RcpC/CpaB domain-containing protein n=1 Tax=Egicoccus halophilus TaxID=1670830 RepID=A0A8J3A8X2_9ACTN|nr:hypothetical protein GCM10011354_11060 [Egicoccus halophilus]
MVAAVLLATMGTTLLVAYVRGAEDRALAGEELVEVLVLREDVVQATAAEDLADLVALERVPLKVRADGSIDELTDVEGQVAAVDLVAGEQLVRSRFLTPTALAEQSEVQVPDGMQQVTISLEPQRAVGGRLTPGDTVGLFASFSLEDERSDEQIASESSDDLRQHLAETTKLILHKLLVTNVQVEQLPSMPAAETDEAGTASSGPELAPTGNLLVTLAVATPQAERVVFAAEHGTIWLSAESEGASEDDGRLRTPRNIFDD